MAKPLHAKILKLPRLNKSILLKAVYISSFFLFSNNLSGQITIESSNDGIWNSSSTWNGEIIPTSPNYATINNSDTIKSGTTVEIDSLTISASGRLVVEGTLIVNGGLNMADNGSELITDSLANVIIFGNASLANKVTINLASYFVVLGDFVKSGSHTQGELTINNAHIYIFGDLDIPNQGWEDFTLCETESYDGITSTVGDDCDAGQLDDFVDNVDPGELPDGIYEEIVGCEEPTISSHPSTSNAQYCVVETAATLAISATGDALTYQWYSDDDTTPEEGDETAIGSDNNTYTPSTSNPGTLYYYCVVTGDCGTVISDVSGAITVNDLPNNTSSGFSGSTICSGQAGALTFNALNTTFVETYTIEYTDGTTTWQQEITSDEDFDFTVPVNPNSTTTYTLTSITNGDNCTRTSGFGDATAQIVVRELPNNTTSGFSGNTICAGETGILTFNALNTTFVETYTIEYTDGTTTWSQTITDSGDFTFNVAENPTVTTTYSLISITNGNGCTRTSGFGDETAQIIVQLLPTATISDDAAICEGQSTNLSVALTGTQPWSITYLDDSTPVTIDNITNSPHTITVTPSGTTTYTLTEVSDANCTGTTSGSATVIIYPLPATGEIIPD
jgi:hypothetical protein